MVKVLLIGDVVGQTGRAVFARHITNIIQKNNIDGVILNGENSCQTGRGITLGAIDTFINNGVNVITTGNHVWQQKESYSAFMTRRDLLKPGNFPHATPGVGVTTFSLARTGDVVGVINIQGRVFMKELLSCPFLYLDSAIETLKSKAKIIFVDFHAETTAEKMAIAHYASGRVSGVVGTHTHVQTADERILEGGTAFITDLGMVGSLNGMLGMKKEPIIQNLINQMPTRFSVDTEPPYILCGVIITVNALDGKAVGIERLQIKDDERCSF